MKMTCRMRSYIGSPSRSYILHRVSPNELRDAMCTHRHEMCTHFLCALNSLLLAPYLICTWTYNMANLEDLDEVDDFTLWTAYDELMHPIPDDFYDPNWDVALQDILGKI